MLQNINPQYTSPEGIAKLKSDFDSAIPCRHLALENFLSVELANDLFENFPKMEDLKVRRKSLNENKAEDYHFDRFHPSFSKLREIISSKEFYAFMEQVTGIEGLHTTQDALGSGVHQGANGSFVDVHIDVNMNPEQGLWRRINLLIYLNRNWKLEYGGDLELWSKDMKVMHKKYPPAFNCAVIFETDERSPHGYSKINIPEGESRKSFYTYYYTAIPENFVYSDSKFVSRPDESLIKKTLTGAKEAIKINAKRLLKKLGVKSLDFQDKNK